MKKLSLLVVFVFFICPLFLKKPSKLLGMHGSSGHFSPRSDRTADPVLMLSTSLHDSLPHKTLRDLGLLQVTGLKFKFRDGLFASYFEYTSDKSALLQSLSLLPVPFHAMVADTTYRKIEVDEIMAMRKAASVEEIENVPEFWSATQDDYEAFECIKPPLRHLLLLSKTSQKVFHRVDPVI